jgi:intein/homing endonuclease
MVIQDPNDYSDLLDIDLPFDLAKVRPQCIRCVRRQIEKFKGHVDENKKSLDRKFVVPCDGILLDPVDPRLKHVLSKEEWEQAQVVLDPVKWAAKYITHPDDKAWIARFYQEEVMRCTSRRRALRISRRTGKTDVVSVEICYHMFTKKSHRILVAAPQKVHVEEIIERVRGFLLRNPLLHNEVVRDVSSPFYEIKLSNDSRVRGFALGTRGKSEGVAVRGQNADRVYCLPKGSLVHTSEFGLRPIESLTLQDTVLGGDNNNIEVGVIKNIGVREDVLITIPTALATLKCTPDHPLFNGEEDVPAKNATQVISSLYYRKLTFGRDVVLARLLGYLYGDGWISKGVVGFSGSKTDLEQIQEDLSFLGIPKTTINTRETENKDLGIKGITSQFKTSYALPLFKDKHPEGKKVFQSLRVPKEIRLGTEYVKSAFLSGLFSAEGEGVKYQVNRKTPKVIRLNMRSLKEEWISCWMSDLSSLIDSLGIKHHLSITPTFNKKDGEDRFVGTITVLNSKDNIDIFIKKIGYCYNAEKTISANTYKLFRKYEKIWNYDSWKHNRKIRSMANMPYSAIALHVPLSLSGIKYNKKLYNELYSEDLLSPSEYIEKIRWKGNYVKLPIIKEGVRLSKELVDVYNLTSGAKNRFFANSMFTHNCDEMDYADDKAIIGGLFPILQTTKDAAMTGFSTPTGFKSTYYSICEEVPSYVEFFYNYKVLPHWKIVEKDRPQYTDDEWTHEMLAEWGTSESGVYKPSYIDRSLRSYRYEELRPSAGWRYTMGVDWNEKHGAELVIVGENISGGFYQVMHASVVEKSEFTQLLSIQAMINLYKYWNPVSIYVDAGNGSTNYELIRKMSYDQRVPGGDPQIAKLLDIVKRYDSGASIETKDPITNEKRKVPAKPYMVNAAVRAFEQDKMRISSADKILEKELRNYIIDRISPTGTPVYTMRDQKIKDHRLDAFNLAMVSFFKEFGGLQQNTVITQAFAAVNPISKQINTASRSSDREDPSERRLDVNTSGSILAGLVPLPAHVGSSGSTRIAQTNTGKEYDMEAQYHQMYLQRQRRRSRVSNQGNGINRSNI